MKMAAFDFHRPASLSDATALLALYRSDSKILAGGQSLVPMLAMRLATPAHLIDITGVEELRMMTVDADGSLTIGAAVRHANAEGSDLVRHHAPLLAKALPWVGHRAIRNRGTVCGSLAHADSAAELPAVAVALDATLSLRSERGVREVSAADFFEGYLTTVIADDELLTSVKFPARVERSGFSVVEIARRHGDFAIAGLACGLGLGESGLITKASLAFFGVADVPRRLAEVESLLVGREPLPSLFREVGAAVSGALDPPGDVHATAAYRKHVAGVLAVRGLEAATADAGVTREVAA